MEMGLNDIYMIVRELETCSSVKAKEHILRILIMNYLKRFYYTHMTQIKNMEYQKCI